eukprot:4570464-Prymnesium_polylepis.1
MPCAQGPTSRPTSRRSGLAKMANRRARHCTRTSPPRLGGSVRVARDPRRDSSRGAPDTYRDGPTVARRRADPALLARW